MELIETETGTVMVSVADNTNCGSVSVFSTPISNSIFRRDSFVMQFDKKNMPFEFALESETATDLIQISK